MLALGVRGGAWRPTARIALPGADLLRCTRVEADLFDAQDVAVVGGGNSAGQAVMFLAECCPSRTVHLLVRARWDRHVEYLVKRIRPPQRGDSRTDRNRGSSRDSHLEAIRLRNNLTGATRNCPAGRVRLHRPPTRRRSAAGRKIARDAKGSC